MAIFHMNFSNISAGKGRSAVASASYRSGEKLYSEMENKTYFYNRSVMPESFILYLKMHLNGLKIDKNYGTKLKQLTVK